MYERHSFLLSTITSGPLGAKAVATTAGWLPPPQKITSWELFIVEMVACRYDTGSHTVTLAEGH